MKYRLSDHAGMELRRRQIPQAWIESLLAAPEQRIREAPEIEVWQSRFTSENGKIYLLRAVLDIEKEPAVAVTIYRTSKTGKYWRPE